jgi:membrane-associated phospholipid phosphatase
MTSSKRERIKAIILGQFALLSLEIIIVIILSILAVIAFYQMSSLLLDDEIAAFDEKVYFLVRYYASPFLDKLMLAVTFLGNRQFIVFPGIGIMIYYLFIRPHRWYSIKIPAVALGSISTNLLLKELYDRARPTVNPMIEASGLSFPSGHAMFNLSFYGLLIFLIWKEVKDPILKVVLSSLLFLLIILIGISRIYLGVHYASDVLAGFAAGFLWLIIALFVTNTLERKAKEKEKIIKQ